MDGYSLLFGMDDVIFRQSNSLCGDANDDLIFFLSSQTFDFEKKIIKSSLTGGVINRRKQAL